jgi:cystathionine beta-lyase/cystathionine gamma-synthase
MLEAIPVAHTRMFIADSLIRVSVGIDDNENLLADFDQALASHGARRQQ